MPALPLTPTRRPLARVLAVAATATVLLATALADSAAAHGSTIDPPSRNYRCWKVWGNDFQNPAMATQDPMCWQAWQHDPNAMWNWNGLYVDNIQGNYQSAIPDGTICSAGRTGDGRYNSLDVPGEWVAQPVSNNFTVRVHDQALHGADFYRVYVTRQGYNPVTQPLRWADLELRADTGRIAPGAGTRESDPVLNGVTNSISVSAPGRTGRHIVFVNWKASHADQTYYWCSDVIFPGGPTSSPSPTPTQSPSASPTSSPSASPTPSGGGTGACSASYSVTNQWAGGFQAEVRVTAGSAAINGWTVSWTFANGQQVSQVWNATVSSSGATVTARNVSYNGSLGAGASTSFGFIGSWNGTNSVPTPTCTAT
jgi:chitin-binding protein